MLGVLQKALGRHAVAGGIGIPGKLAVALEDMVGGAADLHVGAVGIEIPVRPASAATTAAATHIAVAVRTAALGTAATLTILVHSVISQVSNIAQSGEVRTRLAPHDIAREAVVLSIE